MKAAIYARKSRATEKGESIEHQIERGIAYCEEKGWEYVVYSDYDYSAGTTKRPDFQRMMTDIETGVFDALVCYKLARVCRNVKDFANLYDWLFQKNVSFISLKENFDTSTSFGRMYMYFTAMIAEMERDNIAEQVTDNMLDRAKVGKWNGGPVPIGYTAIKEEGKNIKGNKKISSRLIIDDEEAKIIKFIYDEYLKPDGSIRGIAKKLILQGYKTKNNKEWRLNQVNRVLKNALYCIADEAAYKFYNDNTNPIIIINDSTEFNGERGLMYYNRRKQKNHTTTEPREKEEWILSIGEHQGIISGEIFVAAQRKLNMNFARPARFGTSTKSPLTGLVRCKECNSSMNIVSSKINKKEEGYSYIYFDCRRKTESSGELCNTSRINARYLEKRILDCIKEFFSSEDKVNAILADYNKQIKQNKVDLKDIEEKKKNIKRQLSKVEKGIENLVNAIAENLIPSNIIKSKYAELENQKEILENELNLLGFKLIDNEIQINSKYVINTLKEIKPADLEDMNFEIRKNFYRSIIKNIYINDENIEIQMFFSLSNGLLLCPRMDRGSLMQPS